MSDPAFPYPVLAGALRERHRAGLDADDDDDDFRFAVSAFIGGLRRAHDPAE